MLDDRRAVLEKMLNKHCACFPRWWQTSDEPWQTLAACREIAKALRCGKDPSEYVSHFPIHQDGSCNGLQHYAALGRDIQGAAQVSLIVALNNAQHG